MKTHIRKLSEKSLDIINQKKEWPDEKIIEGYHIVGPGRSRFREKPFYIFLEKFSGGGYNIRYGTREVKKILGHKRIKWPIEFPEIISCYTPPQRLEEEIKEALRDPDYELAWGLIRKLWEEKENDNRR